MNVVRWIKALFGVGHSDGYHLAMCQTFEDHEGSFFDATHEAWEAWQEHDGWGPSFRETARAADLPRWGIVEHGRLPSQNKNNQALERAGRWFCTYGDSETSPEVCAVRHSVRDATSAAYLFWLYAGEHIHELSDRDLHDTIRLHGIGFLAAVYFHNGPSWRMADWPVLDRVSRKIKKLGGVV